MQQRFSLRTSLAKCSLWMVVLLGFAPSISAQSPGQQVVITQDAPLLLYPDASRPPVLMIKKGVVVRVKQLAPESDDWFIVTVEGSQLGDRTGYVEAKFLAPASPPPVSVKPSLAPTATPAPAAARVGTATSSSTATSQSARVTASSSTPTAPSASVIVPKDPQPPASVPITSPGNTSPVAPNRVSADASRPYTNDQLGRNIQIGAKGKGRIQGVLLVDAAQRFFASLGPDSSGTNNSNGFSVIAYTPLAWVRQLASDAAKEYRPYTVANVSDEALEPVFRVVAYPDTPNTVTAAGLRGTASVQHVVLRDESRKIVVQPTFKESFTQETSNAMGGRATFEGVRVKFAMSDVRELRGAKGDREFFITVIGNTGEEKDFKVKKKHFDDLP